MSRPRHFTLSAGVVDTALASLATFLVGLFAIRHLSPAALGAYALAFTAVSLAGIIPAQLLFAPLEVAAVSRPAAARLRFLRATLRIALAPALSVGLLVAGWTFFAPKEVPGPVLLGLTVTGIVFAGVSTVQDHVRSMLHIADESWIAATVSAIHVLVVGAGIILFLETDLPPWWCPFGVLAAANIVSLTAGVVMSRSREPAPSSASVSTTAATAAALPDPRFRDVSRLGGWLLLVGLIPNVATFFASALVARLAGAAMLGYAEAARLVAMPMLVLARGLGSVLGPRLMDAARRRDEAAAHQLSTLFVRLIVGSGVLYFVLVGHDWVISPFTWLTPKAYGLAGLVALAVISHVLQGLAYPGRVQMMGSEQGAALAKLEAVINALRVALAPLAALIGPYVIPLSDSMVALVRVFAYRIKMKAHFASGAVDVGAPPGEEPDGPRDLMAARPSA
jgi:O-antigen/teichoic acid export membrane protein